MQKNIAITVLLLALMAVAMPVMVAVSARAAGSFGLTVSPAKNAYYVGETAQLRAKLTWDGLDQNITLNFQLWNSSAQIGTLASNVMVPGATNENGTQEYAWTTNLITAKAGSATYIVKAVEANTGLTVAQATVNVVVETKSIVISIAWADANADRQIDVSEQVTYTIYINWAFANETEVLSLYVQDGLNERLLDTVTITQGSGSATKIYSTSYDSTGVKSLKVWLEDADGKTVASKTITVQVGQSSAPAAAPAATSWLDQINTALGPYTTILLVFAVIVLIAMAWKMRK